MAASSRLWMAPDGAVTATVQVLARETQKHLVVRVYIGRARDSQISDQRTKRDQPGTC